jgi:hypothetical protein
VLGQNDCHAKTKEMYGNVQKGITLVLGTSPSVRLGESSSPGISGRVFTLPTEPNLLDQNDRESRCDHCGGRLDKARLIAGGSDEPKHFCSFACFDLWKLNSRSKPRPE